MAPKEKTMARASESKRSREKEKAETKSTPEKQEEPEDEAISYHYSVFCLLYMMGGMLHFRKYYDNNIRINMTHIVAYILLSQRSRNVVFLSYLLFCMYSTVHTSPYNANHHNVMGFISLLLLPQQIRRCWYGPVIKAGTAHALNVVRWAIIIMYFMAGFHKLNTDFFIPQVSCAYDTLWNYLGVVGIDEEEQLEDLPWWLHPLPYVGVFAELVPPILMLFASTQKFGVLMLVMLHWLLLPVGFADFGSIAQSLLWLFVSPIAAVLPWQYYSDMAGCFVFVEAIVILLWERFGEDNAPFQNEEAAMVFIVYAMHWGSILRANGLRGVRLYRPKSFWSLLALVSFVWFALNPYLGLRTVGTLTMFSNLRTEGPTSNHLLLHSNPLKMFGYQEDVVNILDLDERFEDIDEGHLYQKLAFDRVMIDEWESGGYGVYLKVEYKGVVYETDDLNNDPNFDIFRQEESWWHSKFFDFRAIQKEGPQECMW